MKLGLPRRSFILYLACPVLFGYPSYPVCARDTEVREFSIFVDGKDAGTSKMTVIQEEDGSSYMSAVVEVKFRQLIAEYTLKIETQEWWKDGRLIGMKTQSLENGKKTDVLVALKSEQLHIRVNNQERMLKPETWTTSYWKLADARLHNKPLSIIEVDSGREFQCDLKFLGTKQLKIDNQLLECYQFRVTGGPAPIELWYDRYHRLVRQEFTELGHKTIVQLARVVRR